MTSVADVLLTDAAVPVATLQDHELLRLDADLVERFCPPLRPDDVHTAVVACAARYEGARVRTYLSILVERAATQALRTLIAGTTTTEVADVVPIDPARAVAAVDLDLDLTTTDAGAGRGHEVGPDGSDPSGPDLVVDWVVRVVTEETTT